MYQSKIAIIDLLDYRLNIDYVKANEKEIID
jgi:hypothetical protein